MRSWKVKIVSLLLGAATCSVAYTQIPAKLALSVHSGLAPKGAPIFFVLRIDNPQDKKG
jgi:hypothetical protein